MWQLCQTNKQTKHQIITVEKNKMQKRKKEKTD